MKKIFTFLFIACAGIALHAHAISIDVIPNNSQINVGDSVSLQVAINGLTDFNAPSLGDYDINLNYNTNIFSIASISWGDASLGDQLDLSGFGSLTDQNHVDSGILNLFELSFDNPWDLNSLQAGNFTLFSVVFSSLAQGTADFSLGINAIGDAFGNPLDIDAINSARVNVTTQVPEPSSLLLALIGLALILLRARKI